MFISSCTIAFVRVFTLALLMCVMGFQTMPYIIPYKVILFDSQTVYIFNKILYSWFSFSSKTDSYLGIKLQLNSKSFTYMTSKIFFRGLHDYTLIDHCIYHLLSNPMNMYTSNICITEFLKIHVIYIIYYNIYT